jgi:acetolactate synthase-1/3 small subunit
LDNKKDAWLRCPLAAPQHHHRLPACLQLAAFEKVLTRFGIVELVRTGRIALKRGEQLFASGGQWGAEPGAPAPAARAPPPGAPAFDALSSQHDVYAVGSADNEGVWNVQNILDAAYNPTYKTYDPFTLSIDVQDVPGVLNQVTGVIARRGYNVQSLAVGPSEREGLSRITLVLPGDTASITKLTKQLLKLVYVERVAELHVAPHVARELLLAKVSCAPGQRGELMDLAKIFHGSVTDVSRSTLTMEVTGKESKMRALQEALEPYGILEVARTGRVALARESGVDTRYLSSMAGSRVML